MNVWYTEYRKTKIKKPTYSELLWRVILEVGSSFFLGLLYLMGKLVANKFVSN